MAWEDVLPQGDSPLGKELKSVLGEAGLVGDAAAQYEASTMSIQEALATVILGSAWRNKSSARLCRRSPNASAQIVKEML